MSRDFVDDDEHMYHEELKDNFKSMMDKYKLDGASIFSSTQANDVFN